jgi:hypothetical protein
LHPDQVKLNNTLHPNHKSRAIRCWTDSLSAFGSGTDLSIYEAPAGKKSFSNLGNTYELPKGCNHEKAKSYLSGSERFSIKEIEVFLITFK